MTEKEKGPEYGGCIEIAQNEIRESAFVLHDWRLKSRSWTTGRDWGSYWLEVWYCTRCRLVEEKRV
jgi:hypothetical protein